MTLWHKCKTDDCSYRIQKEHGSFPYCNGCEIRKLNKLDYPIKFKVKFSFSTNELVNSVKKY